MTVQIRDFVDVAVRSQQLGCRVPARLALLPGNFSTAANVDEFVFHPATQHIRSAWQSVGLEDESPDQARDTTQSSPIGIVSQADTNVESVEVPLVAFFGSGLLTGPEWSLAVALSLVTRVLALHHAGASPWKVRFDAVVERTGTHGCTCIEYQGDVYGIVELCTDVRRVLADR